MAKFKHLLQERLKELLPEEKLQFLPSGFQQIGNKALLTLNPEVSAFKMQISSEILKMFQKIKGVYLKAGAITGEYRTPQIEFLVGKDESVITHKEHGISYKFDIKEIMFSKGNINERVRISKLVQPGEIIFDLFAGIGYFSLVIGKTEKPQKIFAFELNPTAYQYLVENIKLNQINKNRELIVPILGDSKVEALNLAEKADRVIMGILPAPKNHIDTVFQIIKSTAIVHYEGLVKEETTADTLFNDFKLKNEKYKRKLELEQVTYVKSYGPKVYHATLDIKIL